MPSARQVEIPTLADVASDAHRPSAALSGLCSRALFTAWRNPQLQLSRPVVRPVAFRVVLAAEPVHPQMSKGAIVAWVVSFDFIRTAHFTTCRNECPGADGAVGPCSDPPLVRVDARRTDLSFRFRCRRRALSALSADAHLHIVAASMKRREREKASARARAMLCWDVVGEKHGDLHRP